MKKISIILDSLCGLKKEEVLKKGFYFLPQIVRIDDKEYEDGVDLTYKEGKKMFEDAKSFSTSMPPIGQVTDLFEKLSKESENVIFLPMNKGISSTFSSAKAASKDFPNVHVISTKLVGWQLINMAEEINKMINESKTLEEIISKIEKYSSQVTNYVIPKTLDTLVKSGRLKGLKKIILQSINIIPKLYFSENGFMPKSFRRNFKKMLLSTIDSFVKNKNINDYDFFYFSTLNEKSDNIIETKFKELKIPFVRWIVPTAVGVHSGDGTVGICFSPKITTI